MDWKIVKSPILEMREILSFSQAEFADYFGIPLSTIQNWEQLQRVPPLYVTRLIKFRLVHDFPDIDFSDILHSDFAEY